MSLRVLSLGPRRGCQKSRFLQEAGPALGPSGSVQCPPPGSGDCVRGLFAMIALLGARSWGAANCFDFAWFSALSSGRSLRPLFRWLGAFPAARPDGRLVVATLCAGLGRRGAVSALGWSGRRKRSWAGRGIDAEDKAIGLGTAWSAPGVWEVWPAAWVWLLAQSAGLSTRCPCSWGLWVALFCQVSSARDHPVVLRGSLPAATAPGLTSPADRPAGMALDEILSTFEAPCCCCSNACGPLPPLAGAAHAEQDACSDANGPRRNKPLSGQVLRKLDQELEEALAALPNRRKPCLR